MTPPTGAPAPTFTGIIPPVATPMTAEREVDHASLERLVDHLVTSGVHGLFALGSTGETAYLTDDERVEVVSTIASANAGRVPIIAGAIDLTSARILAGAKRLVAAGADAIVTTAAVYAINDGAETADHFRRVAAGIDVPLFAYDVPV